MIPMAAGSVAATGVQTGQCNLPMLIAATPFQGVPPGLWLITSDGWP